jgi:hypothetical protein
MERRRDRPEDMRPQSEPGIESRPDRGVDRVSPVALRRGGESGMRSKEPPELHRLRERLDAILRSGRAPSDEYLPSISDEHLPYLMNLAAAVAAHYPPLDANRVLKLAIADVQNRLERRPELETGRTDKARAETYIETAPPMAAP